MVIVVVLMVVMIVVVFSGVFGIFIDWGIHSIYCSLPRDNDWMVTR